MKKLAIALAVIAVLLHAAPGGAQTPASEPTASPDPMVSAAPAIDATAAPTAEPTYAPADESSPAPAPAPRSLRGTLLSVSGTIAKIRMANGAVQTYTVSAKTAALLKKSIGKKVVFHAVRGVLNLLPH